MQKMVKVNLFIVLFLKIILISFFPLTGDEAYFIFWADNINIGFYDHPPMIGWVVYLMSFIIDDFRFFRLFSFFSALLASYLIYKILLEFEVDKERSKLIGVLFLFMPVDVLMILIVNDIPLFIFGLLGGYFLLKSLRVDWLKNAFISGLFLGLSFLSKYFSVFLILGLVLYVIFSGNRKHLKNVMVVLLVVVPFGLQNLYFNYVSCWNNIMFNFFARSEGLEYSLKTFVGFLFVLIYYFTPWGVYYLLKSKISKDNLLKFILFSVSVGAVVYTIVSLKKTIGLHWLLLFIPFIVMLFSYLKEEYMVKMIKYTLVFTYMHIVVLLVISFLPSSLFESNKNYNTVLMFKNTDLICEKIERYDNVYATDYTSSAILSYHCDERINVVMNNSKYGRESDKVVDVNSLQGESINIFYRKPPNIKSLEKVFDEVEIKEVPLLNTRFYIAEVKNIKYEEYKKYYLDVQREKFYDIPDWLPQGMCYFHDRYYD